MRADLRSIRLFRNGVSILVDMRKSITTGSSHTSNLVHDTSPLNEHEVIPRVIAVVLNWRTCNLAIRCIESILHSGTNLDISILFVDNASGDESVETVRRHFGEAVTIIEATDNRGYAAGMNIGLKYAVDKGAQYALLLNADITLSEKAIDTMVMAAEAIPDGALFGPRIYDEGKPTDKWFIGGRWDWGQGTIRVVRESESDCLTDTPREIEFVNGAAMLVRLSVLGHVGLLDEDYGLYFEESDLCSRMRKAGYTLWHVPRSNVEHAVGASSSHADRDAGIDVRQYYLTRNRLLWGSRNLSGLKSVVFWLNAVVRLPIKCFTAWIVGRRGKARAVAFGIRDFYCGRLGMYSGNE